jgi:hypothetical protein
MKAFILVLLEQRFEDGASLLPVFCEKVPLADTGGALPARQRRPVESHVADQVERVEVLADFLGQRIEQQSFVRQLVNDGLFAAAAVPLFEELFRIFVDAGAAADDLLELRHRPNWAIEHNQPAGLRIDSGRQQARRGDNDGVGRFGVDEVAELGPAFRVVGALALAAAH